MKHILLIACSLLIVYTTHAQADDDSFYRQYFPAYDTMVNGNLISFSQGERREYKLTDPRIKEENPLRRIISVQEQIPQKLNGQDIFILKEAYRKVNKKSVKEFILDALQNDFAQLPDGDYSLDINWLIFNPDGILVYHSGDSSTSFIHDRYYRIANHATYGKQNLIISNKILQMMSEMAIVPYKIKGTKIPTCLLQPFVTLTINVADHKVTLY
jgi:hypothetical protein